MKPKIDSSAVYEFLKSLLSNRKNTRSICEELKRSFTKPFDKQEDIIDIFLELIKNETDPYLLISILTALRYYFGINPQKINKKICDPLIKCLRDKRPTVALSAAWTIMYMGSTIPKNLDRSNKWSGYDRHEIRYFANRPEKIRKTIPHLIDNLNRPISYDKSRFAKRWSACALGAIGFGRPDLVEKSVEPLIKSLEIPGGNDGVIYALGCIGYKKPELVKKIVPSLSKIIKLRRKYSSGMSLEAIYALRKILKTSD